MAVLRPELRVDIAVELEDASPYLLQVEVLVVGDADLVLVILLHFLELEVLL